MNRWHQFFSENVKDIEENGIAVSENIESEGENINHVPAGEVI